MNKLVSKFKILAKYQVYLIKHPLKSVIGWKMITSMTNLLGEIQYLNSDPIRVLYVVQRLRIATLMALNNDKFNPSQDSIIIKNMVSIMQKELSIAIRQKKRGLVVFVNAYGALMKMLTFMQIHMDWDKDYKPSEQKGDDDKDVSKTLRMKTNRICYLVFLEYRSIS